MCCWWKWHTCNEKIYYLTNLWANGNAQTLENCEIMSTWIWQNKHIFDAMSRVSFDSNWCRWVLDARKLIVGSRVSKLDKNKTTNWNKNIWCYHRKGNQLNIKRTIDTTNERNNALFELINSYVERGIGHEDIESDTEDHKLDNTYTCMKNV